MINRAKCKLCNDIIESHLPDEIIWCKCSAIAVCDGQAMRMLPHGSPNFVRVDDLGNEIIVSYHRVDAEKTKQDKPTDKPEQLAGELPIESVQEAIKALEWLVECDGELLKKDPHTPLTRYDLFQYMLRVIKIFKEMQ